MRRLFISDEKGNQRQGDERSMWGKATKQTWQNAPYGARDRAQESYLIWKYSRPNLSTIGIHGVKYGQDNHVEKALSIVELFSKRNITISDP